LEKFMALFFDAVNIAILHDIALLIKKGATSPVYPANTGAG
jgi:hypothetical protein